MIDDVIAISGAQQFEEVETALRNRGCKPSEKSVADLRAEAFLALVARAGVIDADPARLRQTRPQHAASFIQKTLLARDQNAHDLPLGDDDAQALQQRDQTRRRDLSLMVLSQYEAAQFRAEMAIDAGRQGRHHHLAIRGSPALALKVDDVRTDHQILDEKARIAFEA